MMDDASTGDSSSEVPGNGGFAFPPPTMPADVSPKVGPPSKKRGKSIAAVLIVLVAAGAIGGAVVMRDSKKSSTSSTSLAAEINASSCDAMLRQANGQTNDIIPACRQAGFDPVWSIKGSAATAADYDKWRKDNFGTQSASSGDPCPASERYVVYNGTATARYASMTAELPSGTSQQSPDLPIKMNNDAAAQGLHFCASPDQFLFVSFQNPNDSGCWRSTKVAFCDQRKSRWWGLVFFPVGDVSGCAVWSGRCWRW